MCRCLSLLLLRLSKLEFRLGRYTRTNTHKHALCLDLSRRTFSLSVACACSFSLALSRSLSLPCVSSLELTFSSLIVCSLSFLISFSLSPPAPPLPRHTSPESPITLVVCACVSTCTLVSSEVRSSRIYRYDLCVVNSYTSMIYMYTCIHICKYDLYVHICICTRAFRKESNLSSTPPSSSPENPITSVVCECV